MKVCNHNEKTIVKIFGYWLLGYSLSKPNTYEY